MNDFEKAKAYVTALVHVKFDWVKRLPWVLSGLAQHDQLQARELACQLLSRFDAQTPEASCRHDSKTLFFLCPSSPMRPALERFAAGAALDSEPLLEFHVASLRFVSIVERWIEGSHSLVSRKSGHNASGAVVSLTRRLAQFEAELAADPRIFSELLPHFQQARHVSRLPSLLGLANHPCFEQASPHQCHHTAIVKMLRAAMYGADLTGQFREVNGVVKFHRAATRQQRVADANALQAAGPPRPAASEELVLQDAFIDHFRKVAQQSDSGAVFTMVGAEALLGGSSSQGGIQ